MNLLYFAYGSNMSSARMSERLGSAQAVGRARIAHSRLAFDKPGRDGTGKANLVESADEWAWGVVWRVSVGELGRLDAYEPGYRRTPLPVELDEGVVRTAQVYLWRGPTSEIPPAASYVAHLVRGATEHALPDWWVAQLRHLHRAALERKT